MREKRRSEHSFERSQVAAFRLVRHHLRDRRPADLTAVCRNVCGIQAQLMGAARMALWARTRDLSQEEIHSALWKRRTLVKTSCMRQTLHLIPASDFALTISALKRSRMEGLMRIMSKFGITQEEVDGMNQSVVQALRAGPMTQGELREQIKPKVGKNMRRWMERVSGAFRPALVEGLICYGPERGQEATFVRTDQWLPERKEIKEQKAKQALLRRYLSAYGPATLQDFSRWAGMRMEEARPVWGSLEDELVEVSVEGRKGAILREDHKALTNSRLGAPVLRLLPSFDPYLLGHAEKNDLVDESSYKRVYRNQGWISPVVLLDGRVIGIWSHTRRGKELSLEVELFQKPSKASAAQMEEEAASLGRFLETSWAVHFRK